MSSTTLSGTFEGNRITLTGVESTLVTIKRATLAEYQAQLGEQNSRSQAIVAARTSAASRQRSFQAQRNFVAEIDQLIGKMQRFDSEADVHLSRFPNAEKEYEAITAKVTEYVTRERQLAGNPNRGVDRSQLSVAANQASLNTDQMHFQAQSLQSSLESNIAPLLSEETTLEQGCHKDGPRGSDLTPVEVEARRSACNRLVDAAPKFHQKYTAVSIGLSHLEEVYKREKDTQGRLLTTAQKLE